MVFDLSSLNRLYNFKQALPKRPRKRKALRLSSILNRFEIGGVCLSIQRSSVNTRSFAGLDSSPVERGLLYTENVFRIIFVLNRVRV